MSASNSAKDPSEISLVFSKSIKKEEKEGDNFGIFNNFANQDIVDIGSVKVEKMELHQECHLEYVFTEPLVQQETFAEDCVDTQDSDGLLDICTNKGKKSGSTV